MANLLLHALKKVIREKVKKVMKNRAGSKRGWIHARYYKANALGLIITCKKDARKNYSITRCELQGLKHGKLAFAVLKRVMKH